MLSKTISKSKTTSRTTSRPRTTSRTKSKSKTGSKTKKAKSKSHKYIEKQCKIYKADLAGKPTKYLYSTCKAEKFCRKYKCKDIDRNIYKTLTNKLGANHRNIILNTVRTTCPVYLSDAARKKCQTKTVANFYKSNGMEEMYNSLIECDKKTCAKEKQAFYMALYRQKKLKLKKQEKALIDTDELEADQDLITTD